MNLELKMSENNLYFKINPKTKKILAHPQKLEENWRNISGLPYLSKSELYDLSWAGYKNEGFIHIEDEEELNQLTCDNEILNQIKIYYRNYVSELRYRKESEVICIDDYFYIQLNDRCKLLLTMKYLECSSNKDLNFRWKTIKGSIEFNSSKFINLYHKIQVHIQNLFEEELELQEKINQCEDINELLNLNLN